MYLYTIHVPSLFPLSWVGLCIVTRAVLYVYSNCLVIKEKVATVQVLSSTVQELANQISPAAKGVQQFVHHLSCSLVGCNRPATPTEVANRMKRHSDSSILSHAQPVKTLRHSNSVGVSSDNHVIYNLLLNQQWRWVSKLYINSVIYSFCLYFIY